MKWEDGQGIPAGEGRGVLGIASFYTGKHKLVDTAGRVEKFKRRYTKKKTLNLRACRPV